VTSLLVTARPASPTDAASIAASIDAPHAFAAVFERHHAPIHRYLARRLGVDPAVPSHDERVAAEADSAAAGPALAAALARLPRAERDVLLLYAWAELRYPEIAAALSISPGTVKSRLHRARRRVRESLKGEADG
jgi:RNA polymerase sigma factor (sigma-70 family)